MSGDTLHHTGVMKPWQCCDILDCQNASQQTCKKTPAFQGSLLWLIRLTTEYKVGRKCTGPAVILLCQLRSAAAVLAGTLSEQLPERRKVSVGQDVFALFHLLHDF